jgi:hypothetical protein
MLKTIAELVQTQGHLVLATCAPGEPNCAPHASLMAYCPSPEGREFWLATLKDTRKFANLMANPRASLLLDDRQGGSPSLALTVEAELSAFADRLSEVAARRALLNRHPALEDLLALDGALVLRLVGLRYQLLNGLTDVFTWSPAEKP